jgi:hypothetical protein
MGSDLVLHNRQYRAVQSVFKRVFSCFELAALAFVSWMLIWYMGPEITSYNTTLLAGCFLTVLLYVGYFSPIVLHQDSNRYRGVGNWKTLFIRSDNFCAALGGFGAIIVTGSAVIIVASLLKNPLIFQQVDWGVVLLKLFCYFFSSTIQGLITLFILLRIIDISSGNPFEADGDAMRGKVLITVVITGYFSLVHMPNIPVMVIVLFFTPVVLFQYFKTPNFFLLVCTHAFLGTLLHRLYDLPMRIGPFYNSPDRYIIRELFPFVAGLIGNSW